MSNVFADWNFLKGDWESDPDSHIGHEDNTINKVNISHRPSDQFLFMVNEAYRSGNPQGEGLSLFFYDEAMDKIKCKSIYGMGFVVNYIEEARTENSLTLFAETVDSIPDGFEHTEWKLNLTKLSEDQFLMTLDMGKDGNFTKFWEAKFNRS